MLFVPIRLRIKLIIRISKQQKKALLLIHFLELKHGLHIPVNSAFIRQNVEAQLNEESSVDITLAPNHFLVSLLKLAHNDYLVYQPNTDKLINRNAKKNENMWQLTEKGRQYAETYLSASLRPKRQYIKSRNKRTNQLA